jgi:hypothetical protein
MKIRVTLKASDDARRCIALNLVNERKRGNLPVADVATLAGTATRETCVAWLQRQLDTAGAAYANRVDVDPVEREETRKAVEQLRACGWRDDRIRAWLLKNAALMEGANLKLWPDPVLEIQQ